MTKQHHAQKKGKRIFLSYSLLYRGISFDMMRPA
ncbi:hypothetical protein BN439_2338 [Erwinia amylovora Ea644]|nr:hypothetical protein BN439_2338 [Erwinia amylovora Ea644]CCP07411.1 hypothetical protein BN440_2389 [Erwinia amylovora MR1]